MSTPTRYCSVCCEEINLNRLAQQIRYKARRCQDCIDSKRGNGGKPHCVHCRAELEGYQWACTPLCDEGKAALGHPDMKVPLKALPPEYRYARMMKPRPDDERRLSQNSRAEYVEAPTTLTESGKFLKAQVIPVEPKKRPRRRIVELGNYEGLRDKR